MLFLLWACGERDCGVWVCVSVGKWNLLFLLLRYKTIYRVFMVIMSTLLTVKTPKVSHNFISVCIRWERGVLCMP